MARTGVPQAIASIIASPNGSRQAIGNSKPTASPRNSVFWCSAISPMNSTCGWRQHRFDFLLEIFSIDVVDLGRNL